MIVAHGRRRGKQAPKKRCIGLPRQSPTTKFKASYSEAYEWYDSNLIKLHKKLRNGKSF
jgi:hypothetical protein